MKTPDEIVALLAYRIGEMYYHGRPLMYGGTPWGVHLYLNTLHYLWAEIVERVKEFNAILEQTYQEEDCGACDFSTRYAINHPKASKEEIAQYTMAQWRKVSDRLGVPIPHAALKREFDELQRQLSALNRPTQ
jgi:hypothetical protein